MVFDHHVHVTGSLFCNYYSNVIENIVNVGEKLRTSLKENRVDRFIGIISSGTFYKMPKNFDEALSINVDLLFDEDGKGLSLVKELGGEPAVYFSPEYILRKPEVYDYVLKKSKEQDVKILKLYTTELCDFNSIIKKAKDYDFELVLTHTPREYECVVPLFKLCCSNDLKLMLCHGCYKSSELMSLVKDYGAFVDTSSVSVKSIKKWLYNDLEDNLVFGSDWPCANNGARDIDWDIQKKELAKLSKLNLPKKFYNREIIK